MDQPGWIESTTFGLALVGAVLGVFNTWWSWWRDRVRIEVAAVWEVVRVPIKGGTVLSRRTEYPDGLTDNQSGLLGVRVTNLGFIEVTIDSVGVTSSGWLARRSRRKRRLRPFAGDAYRETHLPVRLATRESITIWCSESGADLASQLQGTTRVFACTACGIEKYATSGLLRWLVHRAGASS